MFTSFPENLYFTRRKAAQKGYGVLPQHGMVFMSIYSLKTALPTCDCPFVDIHVGLNSGEAQPHRRSRGCEVQRASVIPAPSARAKRIRP